GRRRIHERKAGARIAAAGSREVVGERREVVPDVDAAAFHFEQCRRTEGMCVMAGEDRVVPMLDRLRLDRRSPTGCRVAAEDVVVPGEIAGVVLAEAEIGLDE